MIGISPTFPSTGYGYLQKGEELNGMTSRSVSVIDRFVEKPDLEKAS